MNISSSMPGLTSGGLMMVAVTMMAQAASTGGGLSSLTNAALAPRNPVIVSTPVAPTDNTELMPAPTLALDRLAVDVEMPPPLRMPKTENPSSLENDEADMESSASRIPAPSTPMPPPIRNFEGQNNIYGYYPPDTNGEVGKTRYIQMVNTTMAIYNKAGTKLYGPFLPSSLWPASDVCGQNDDGDPVVLYDQLANRWLVSQFALPSFPNPPYYQCIAVSKTASPTNLPSDWWTYTFQVPNNKMNDYPKLAVWPNAYFMSVNQFVNGSNWGGAGAFAFERTKMLRGDPARMVYYDVGAKDMRYGGMLPSDLDGSRKPPAGAPNYFVEVDDSAWIGPRDALRIWKFKLNWAHPELATFGLDGQPDFTLNTASFNLLPCVGVSEDCIPQPGTTQRLDALGDRLMFRLAYRNFGDHESLTVNHTVRAPKPAGGDRAAIRWYEIRNPGTSPTIFQQGTYGPGSLYRWMGSIAMDKQGNMALGYSAASDMVYPGIRYVGRTVTDPLGTMPQTERTIQVGSGSQTGTAGRWGDYSDMTVDPVDDCTFWYTQEYIQTTGTTSWQTRIASFKFPGCS